MHKNIRGGQAYEKKNDDFMASVRRCEPIYIQYSRRKPSGNRPDGNETEKIDTAQPEFVITERPFLSFEDMEPDEERSQVFSIRNTGAEEEAYYLTIQAPEEITWELTKAGDPYDSGRASGTP